MPPQRRKPTIHDVANATNVSPTTVSHAYSGKRHVDAATRERILQTAAKLGYRPNRAARALRTARTNTIALVVPGTDGGESQEILSLDYYMQLAVAAARASLARGYPLLLAPSVRTGDEIRDLSVDGVIVSDPNDRDARIDVWQELEIPIVTVEQDSTHPEHRAFVRADNEGNIIRLLEHLESAGAGQIALVTASTSWSWVQETETTYRAWCKQHSREAIIERASMRSGRASAAMAAGRLLDRPRRPDAVVAMEEEHALGVVAAARERHLDVPQQLLVAAGIDSTQARFGSPTITAIDLEPALQGAAAADLLVDILEGRNPSYPIVTPSQLHVRRSTSR